MLSHLNDVMIGIPLLTALEIRDGDFILRIYAAIKLC
jgi:hypothetical protein